ncbi:MAG: glycosyltransferase family 4 protein [Bacteroidota bacterium]
MAALARVAIVGTTDVDARMELIRSLSDEFEISVLGSSESLAAKFASEGIDYTTYTLTRRANPILDLYSLVQLFWIFRRLRPALVHTFDTKPSVWARIAARLAGVQVVIGTLPGLGSLYASESFLSRVLRSAYELLQKAACQVSDLTIFQNQDDARQLVENGVVSEAKAMVIPGSGVATAVFARDRVPAAARDELRRELGLQSDELVVTMVSRIIRSKGVLEFAAAARQMRNLLSNLRFLLVGPEDAESLDRLHPAELEELGQAVTWLGARQDVPRILAISDVFVLPSAYREGIPRVLLEAISMGLPVITTDSPGCNEVVEHGSNGFLIQVGDVPALEDAILRLAGDAALRQRFGEISRQLAVERFDLSVIAAQTRAVYEEMLSREILASPAGS